ncbi:DUF4149 domain-containing protein [Pseudomonas sp. PDM18]|uniref:DUF4149 domain-containing protein n=1 Tax=Pseudomonas sp. PDM18 TaxID=2769253 RepID=UPI001781B283|nr:DUF4149 domain-containing protein [Pseudomonas sp. PDM18]MBD9680060.1 DUF4149 domain-containing protein [Pseudomonas sp. PDM18]
MKSATPDRQSLNAGTISWLLAQTFWVGGLWLLQFVVLPALDKIGLAPLLVQTVADGLKPLLLGFAGFCVLVQALVLWQARGLAAFTHETRGQLLLTVLVMAAAYFVVRQVAPDAERWLLFNYLVVALCGLLLVLQPAPGRGERS